MAQRRMFDKELVTSRRFMNLSEKAQLAFFRLGVIADDEGFVGNPDLVKVRTQTILYLENEGFLYRFPSGVVLIRAWYKHNRVRKDTFRDTIFTEEKALVQLNSENIYEYLTVTQPKQEREKSVPQYSIDQNSTEKGSIDQDSIEKNRTVQVRLDQERVDQTIAVNACGGALADCDKLSQFDLFWEKYPKKVGQTEARIIFMGLKDNFDDIMTGLEHHNNCHQWVSDNGFFIPDAANWLKKRGWENRPPLHKDVSTPSTPQPSGATGRLGPEELAAIQRSLAEFNAM